jgi:hypothetical protein
MELKMAVGDANQMSVRVDCGYNVVPIQTIQTVATASPKAPR